MSKIKPIVGLTFGRLTVVSFAYVDRNRRYHWNCECACGAKNIVRGSALHSGNTKSCGCLKFDTKNNLQHGMFGTPEYETWARMIQRCTNENDKSYINYGARGIKVCDEWRNSFDAFYKALGPRPDGMSLDRINNDGNYEPANCRWATKSQQAQNRAPAGTYTTGRTEQRREASRQWIEQFWKGKGLQQFKK